MKVSPTSIEAADDIRFHDIMAALTNATGDSLECQMDRWQRQERNFNPVAGCLQLIQEAKMGAAA